MDTHTRKSRGRARKLVGALVCLLAAAGALALGVRAGLYETLVADPLDATLEVSLNEEGLGHLTVTGRREVTEPRVQISGEATMPGRVRLRRNGVLVDTVTTREDGSFTFDQVSLRPGDNDLVAFAEHQALWRRVTAGDQLRVDYRPAQNAPPPVRRAVNIEVGYREFKVELEATMPKDDPLAVGILTGKLGATQFVEQVFGYLSVNDYFMINYLTDATPAFTSSQTSTTVKLSETLPAQSLRILPPFVGRLKIERLGPSSAYPLAGNDTLTLKVSKDFSIKSVTPPPLELKEGVARWVSGGGQSAPADAIEVQLSSNSATLPLSIFQITPSEVLPAQATAVVRQLAEVLAATPMLWLLLLLRRYKGAAWLDAGAERRLRLNARSLLVVGLLPVALSLTLQLYQHLPIGIIVYSVSNFLLGEMWTVDLIPVVLYAIAAESIFLLSAALAVAALWLRRWRWGYVLFTFFVGMTGAAALATTIFIFAGGVEVLGFAPYRMLTAALLALFSFGIFARAVRWLKAALKDEPDPHAVGLGGLAAGGLLCAAALTAYPRENIFFEIYDVPAWSAIVSYFATFFGLLQDFIPYLLLPAVIFLLRRAERESPGGRILTADGRGDLPVYRLGALIFASYLIGTSPNWFWIPIPFLLALWVFPRMVLEAPAQWGSVHFCAPVILAERRGLIAALDSLGNPKQLQGALHNLEKKFGAGEVSFGDYEKRRAEIEDRMRKHEEVLPLVGALRIKDAVLTLGPHHSDWDNGRWAARRSLFLIIPLLVVYLLVFTLNEIQPQNFYTPLWLCVQVVTFVGSGLTAAFFFGYFFNSIRGTSGLRKGITVSASIIVCLLPAWIVPLSSSSLTNLLGLCFRAGQTFLFFTTLGVWAFDYRNYREAVGGKFRWKSFAKFGDLPSATAFLSVILTSVGVAATTVATGQFTAIVTQVLQVALPSVPVQPPK